MTSDRLSRRRMLTAVGLASTSAGCAGLLGDGAPEATEGSDDSADSPDDTGTATPDAAPRLVDISIDPTQAQQTDVVTVTATAANDGGSEFTGQIVIGTGDSTITHKDVAIPPGETTTITAEQEVIRVGEQQFEVVLGQGEDRITGEKRTIQVQSAPTSFVSINGTSFTLDGGTFYLSGANPSMEFTLGFSHPHHNQIRPYMFEGLSRVGATIARIQASTGVSLEDGAPFPGEDNEEFFRRFDEVIVRAKRRNIRLSIPIINGAPSYLWDPEKTISTHVPAFVHRSETADKINDFYQDDQCIALYKRWVEELLTHENHLTGVEYRNDPTIMMWELGNEVEYWEPWKRDRQTIRPWIEEVGPFVKNLAGSQLLTTGVHGWPDSRNNFLEDHRPDCIDVCSLHYWVGSAHYDLPEDEATALLDEKIADAHETLEKPLWFSEYNWGYPGGGDSDGIENEFLEKRNRKLRQMQNRLDEADVAAAAVHELTSKHVLENMLGRHREKGSTEVYADSDTGTVEELRRYARVTREKSTSSTVPDLPPDEFTPKLPSETG